MSWAQSDATQPGGMHSEPGDLEVSDKQGSRRHAG